MLGSVRLRSRKGPRRPASLPACPLVRSRRLRRRGARPTAHSSAGYPPRGRSPLVAEQLWGELGHRLSPPSELPLEPLGQRASGRGFRGEDLARIRDQRMVGKDAVDDKQCMALVDGLDGADEDAEDTEGE